MPSKKSRRKKDWSKVRWTPILWLVALLNILVGCLYSPITSAFTVRVTGVPLADRERVKSILETIRRVPAAQVQPDRILSRIYENPRVIRGNFQQNMFGRAVLRVTMKKVAAIATADKRFLMLEDGMIVPTLVAAPEGLPFVSVPVESRRPNLGFFGDWERLRMARLATSVQNDFKPWSWTLEMQADGVIILQASGGAKVRLGTSENLNQKLAKLNQMVREDEGIIERVRSINLTSPSNPMVVE